MTETWKKLKKTPKVGDVLKFTEYTYAGTKKSPQFLGSRSIEATVSEIFEAEVIDGKTKLQKRKDTIKIVLKPYLIYNTDTKEALDYIPGSSFLRTKRTLLECKAEKLVTKEEPVEKISKKKGGKDKSKKVAEDNKLAKPSANDSVFTGGLQETVG